MHQNVAETSIHPKKKKKGGDPKKRKEEKKERKYVPEAQNLATDEADVVTSLLIYS